ncbi:hypothetical protein ACI6PO_15780 [Agrobacterium tumefaciens]
MIDGGGPEAVMLASSEAMALEIFNALVGPVVALFDSFTDDVHVIFGRAFQAMSNSFKKARRKVVALNS